MVKIVQRWRTGTHHTTTLTAMKHRILLQEHLPSLKADISQSRMIRIIRLNQNRTSNNISDSESPNHCSELLFEATEYKELRELLGLNLQISK